MPTQAEKRKIALLAEIAKQIAAKAPAAQREYAQTFATKYCSGVDADDLLARDAVSWSALTLAHFGFGQAFQSGAPKMRIFNPTLAEHGWEAGCTVIEFVNDDMPFLVDSIAMEINRQGIAAHLIIHPLFSVARDVHGALSSLNDAHDGEKLESWIHVETERITDVARLKALGDGLVTVLSDVRAVVEDWPKMLGKVTETIGAMGGAAKSVPLEELDEARAFLTWAGDSHFTFLGYREYDLAETDGADILKIVPNSGLGILREPKLGGVSQSFNELPAALRALARKPTLLALTKANSRATVHRSGYLDYIGVKRFDEKGKVIGERRFIGLYTSATYHANPQQIPLLRQKIQRVMDRAGFPHSSHDGKNLYSILEKWPRDELFQIGDDELFDTATGVLRLGERARTKLFVRRDIFARFYSCLIYLPRENYNTEVRLKLQEILKRAFNGTSTEFNVQLSESVLARIHMLVRTAPAAEPAFDLKALEAQVVAAVRRWEDGVFERLIQTAGEGVANDARRDFVRPFPAAYTEDTGPDQAVADFIAAKSMTADKPIAMTLYRQPGESADHALGFRLYHLAKPVPLSGSLPMLENMGVRVEGERSYVIERHDAPAVYIHDFELSPVDVAFQLDDVKLKFENAFSRIWAREIENDGFNRLTLAAGLASDEIVMLRAYAKYLKQTGFTFSQQYIENTLARHADITCKLVSLFHSRFDPALENNRTVNDRAGVTGIENALDKVANADEDRILRRILAVMQATVRTNYYQPDPAGKRKSYVSFKLDSAKVPELPAPRPLFEIFVYSPRVEGIHLRGGKVARGGLRWSDRPEDYRTEVLGLMKAQMVKNAVIVPVGSKGGFVLKAAPPATDREAYMKEGIACYQTFLRGLLDLTDNLVKGKVVPPRGVVRHDADDPYLVVAADKGTATFSDYANAISIEYGHWLADAFASGGSAGYDHKKMGITAKGAWESVKRHFREVGKGEPAGLNTQTTDFTVVGVGDMSGDVFGNGMLLSEHIRLVAAFDHRHIFLDPNPDAAKSFKERERMFNLPRSSWEDFNVTLISTGGGIHPRGAKTIALTPEVKTSLGIDPSINAMTPVELMRAILKAPVDLFYNGGIGTYVKASYQSQAEVGDRATDALRVNGNELRCKVVAEGGNLGFTQLGRVEYAQNGGCIYTDAIDNSGGVDCSDHEVNIKILLSAVIDAGKLAEKDRNALLATMTDEVGQLVLKDNYFQTQSLSVSGVNAEKLLDAQARFMRHQEKTGRLNRKVEFLPSDEEIAERKAKKQGLTAPERAVLLAYSKMELFDDLVASNLIDDEYVAHSLVTYFPTALQEKFADVMPRHPLKREIIATEIANSTINRTGSVFVHRMQEEAGATAAEVVRCYILTRDVFRVGDLWDAVDALDNKVSAAAQSEMLIDAGRLVLRATLWFLRRRAERMPIADVLQYFAPGVATISKRLPEFLAPQDLAALKARESQVAAQGVPATLASEVARLDAMYSVLDIVENAKKLNRAVELAAQVYFALAGKLDMRWIAGQVTALPSDTHWRAMARAAMRDDLANLQGQLTSCVLKLSPSVEDPLKLIATWEAHHEKALAHMREVMADLKSARTCDLAMLSVLLRELRMLA
ncbi:MAG: NAD-glutamate dehydrogenase [Betaproteobacteria bacterium]|nr:NAD-glutamate dehydrogenase [Betaproteobacteria bacterium]